MIKYAWYSNKQFEIISNKFGNKNDMKPYIYYIDINDQIIQVTQVTDNLEHKTQFDDIKYLSEVKEFYKISSYDILIKNN